MLCYFSHCVSKTFTHACSKKHRDVNSPYAVIYMTEKHSATMTLSKTNKEINFTYIESHKLCIYLSHIYICCTCTLYIILYIPLWFELLSGWASIQNFLPVYWTQAQGGVGPVSYTTPALECWITSPPVMTIKGDSALLWWQRWILYKVQQFVDTL